MRLQQLIVVTYNLIMQLLDLFLVYLQLQKLWNQ